MELDPNGLEILDHDECLRLLRSQVLGRIGVTADAHPVVLPVNYCLFDGQLVIQTGQGTRLAAGTDRTVVAFEIDDVDAHGHGWSVALTGIALEITDTDMIDELRTLPFNRWVRTDRDRYVGISLDTMSGRRMTRAVSQPGPEPLPRDVG
jgi:uncharacterized protein